MRYLLILVLLGVVGCSGQARMDYYAAVQAAAVAQSQEAQARYLALSQMASQGGETGAAAVMALALTRNPTIQPAYIESDALAYTKALAAPLAGIAALWIQADANENIASHNAQVQMASIRSNAKIQMSNNATHAATVQSLANGNATGNAQALTAFGDLATTFATASTQTVQVLSDNHAAVQVATSADHAGNIDNMTTALNGLSVQALDTAENLGMAGMDAATSGYSTIETLQMDANGLYGGMFGDTLSTIQTMHIDSNDLIQFLSQSLTPIVPPVVEIVPVITP